MLRRWTESTSVEFGFDEVRARRMSFRGNVMAEALRTNPPSGDAIGGALASFDAVLGEVLAGPGRARPLDLILDDAWTYVDVVAGRFGGMTKAQIQRIARGCVDEVVPRHEVQWQLQPGAEALLIAAMPQVLLAELDAAARRRGVDLRSIAVRAIRRWNGARARLGGGDVVFASVGRGFMVCMHARGGAVDAVTQAAIPGGDETGAALDLQVDRMLALRGVTASAARRFVVTGLSQAASPRWDLVEEEAS